MSDAPEPETSEQNRLMGCSRSEFHHSVKALLPESGWTRNGESYRWEIGNGSVELEAGEQTVQRIASLELPRLNVVLRFRGVNEEAKAAFLRRFEIAFQRGGG
ncbi:MAG: hypothetical protein ACPG4N_02320 [Gammaproteobacteria bacterium]